MIRMYWIEKQFSRCLRTALFAVLVITFSSALSLIVYAQKQKDASVKPDKENPLKEIWSGLHYVGKDIQSLQKDSARNPGYAWVKQGEKLWTTVEGEAKKSCSSCHNKASASMKGVGTRYPRYYEAKQTLINLEDRVNLCRGKFMKAPLLTNESEELIALTMYVKNQSLGTPVNVKVSGPATPFFEKGKKLYYKRRGQLNLSCASCHEHNSGKKLRSITLSQGHSNGYPAYRLGWEKPGSLGRRINQCNKIIRAVPLFADDIKSLELYLGWRGKGLPVETPAVRQ